MIEPLTVAHVLAPAPVGGLERVVTGLAAGHGERGHSVHVVSVFDAGQRVTPLPLDGAAGVTQHLLEIPRRRYDLERRAVRELCRREGVQILHTHGYRPDVIDSPVARGPLRSVTTVHGFTGGSRKNRFFEWLQVRRFRGIDAVVAVSRLLADQLAARGVPQDRLRTIPNAWSGARVPLLERGAARRALGVPDEAWCVGWVGRLSREKGADVLVSALAAAPGVTAAIIGSGPELGRLRELAARSGADGRVIWCGDVPDASRCFSAFDAFALSSRTEGTPIVLFEAMAAGVPLVVTRVGGVPDVVGEPEALLVPSEDPPALAAALTALREHAEEAGQRAARSTRRLETMFARAPWLDRYEALYRELLSRGSA